MRIYLIAPVFLLCHNAGFAQCSVDPYWYVDSTYNFESNHALISIDTTIPGNVWQVGTPSKIIFNASAEGSRAIVTDTINNYPASNYSAFRWIIFYPKYSERNIAIKFRHMFDTDTLRDGGYIEMSHDGQKWWNVIDDTTQFEPGMGNFHCFGNFYDASDTIHNGKYAFSGNSNGWIESTIELQWVLGVKRALPDTFYFRFVFESDSLDNGKEGWMIDDIRYRWFQHGSLGELSSEKISISPNPSEGWVSVNTLDDSKPIHSIVVYGSDGKKVRELGGIGRAGYNADLSLLPGGVYFVNVYAKDSHLGGRRVVIY